MNQEVGPHQTLSLPVPPSDFPQLLLFLSHPDWISITAVRTD